MELIKHPAMTCWNYAFQTNNWHEGINGIIKRGYKEVASIEGAKHAIILMYDKINQDWPINYHYIRFDNGIYSAKNGKGGPFVESQNLLEIAVPYLRLGSTNIKVFVKTEETK